MPELPLNQASGLLGLADTAGPQLIAVVSHGDERSELPSLWQLCAALVELDYTVTVLDATHSESADNPGLQQLLEYRFGYGPVESYASEWNVLPAAQGIHSLCVPDVTLDTAPLQRIGHLFGAHCIVILFARADTLGSLLEGSGVQPLICVSNEKNSLLSSYLTLKHLLIHARLHPTLLNRAGGPHNRESAHAGSVCGNLRTCARNFLGYEVNAITIDTSLSELQQSATMRRLALRLLESALPLQQGACAQAAGAAASHPDAMGRSH